MADYLIKDTQLAALADLLREKTGTSEPLVFPSGFESAIEDMVRPTVEDAIRQVSNVRACMVRENTASTADARGIPGNSLCAVVSGGNATAIAQAIYDSMDHSLATWGTTSAYAQTPSGGTEEIFFSRATAVTTTITLELVVPSNFNRMNLAKIGQALAVALGKMEIGQSLDLAKLRTVIFSAVTGTPDFTIDLLTATANGEVYREVLSAGVFEIISVPENLIHISTTEE